MLITQKVSRYGVVINGKRYINYLLMLHCGQIVLIECNDKKIIVKDKRGNFITNFIQLED